MNTIRQMLRRTYVPRKVYHDIQYMLNCHAIPHTVWMRSMNMLASLHKCHAGKRCFIIGNGPSLLPNDLSLLKDEYTFASNRIYSIYEKTSWRPTYYCVQDDKVIDDIAERFEDVLGDCQLGFFASNNFKKYRQNVIGHERFVLMPKRFSPPRKNIYPFSTDAQNGIYEGLTVTYSAIQMASYMGFAKIYLLGVDHSYSIEVDNDGNIIKKDQNQQDYFTGAELKHPEDKNLPKVIEMTRAFLSAEKYSRSHGFRIFNATRGGKLETFERVPLEQVLTIT